MRRLHRAARRRAGAVVPDARRPGRRRARSPPSRGWRPAPDRLHPVQEAFRRSTGCSAASARPGILMTVDRLPRASTRARATRRSARELAGNLCRCTGYQNIVRAVRRASLMLAGDPARRRSVRARRPERAMTTRMIGARILRNEDPRLLRGLGCFVDDMDPAGRAARRRACAARTRTRASASHRRRARRARCPACTSSLTAADLGELNQPAPLLIPHPGLTQPRTQRPLAVDEVRFVGEIGGVRGGRRPLPGRGRRRADRRATTSRCPPSSTSRRRSAAGGAARPRRRARQPRRAASRSASATPTAPSRRAAHVLRERLVIERSCGSPIEGRGVVAEYEPRTGVLRVWNSTQAPLPIKNGLARMFGLPEFKVEVIAPDIGGGFGTKIMLFYPGGDPRPVRRAAPRPAREVDRGPARAPASPPTRSAARSTTSRSRSTPTGASSPCATASCTTPAPTRRTASSCRCITATQLPGPYRLRELPRRVRRGLHEQGRGDARTAARAGRTAPSSWSA